MRLAALDPARRPVRRDRPADDRIDQALLAHLCRCTGWQTIGEAAGRRRPAGADAAGRPPARDRATCGGLGPGHPRGRGRPSRSGPAVVLGRAGSPTTPARPTPWWPCPTAPAATPWPSRWRAARARAGKVQGRQTSLAARPPGRGAARGDWALTLRTTWVEPAYVEPDASWCAPGRCAGLALRQRRGLRGEAALAGGARTPAGWPTSTAARCGSSGRARTWSGSAPKRPPVAGGIDADGTGVLRVGVADRTVSPPDAWASLVAAVAAVAPGLVLEPVPLAGPPVSFDLRAAVWAEAAVLAAAARRPCGPVDRADAVRRSRGDHRSGRRAGPWSAAGRTTRSRWRSTPARSSTRWCSAPTASGPPTRRSGWVRSEGIAVDEDGTVQRPDHPVVRHPAGPDHAPGRRRRRGRDRAGRSTAPTRCSPPWPPPVGWPTACRRGGRWRGRGHGPLRAAARAAPSERGHAVRTASASLGWPSALPRHREHAHEYPVGPYTADRPGRPVVDLLGSARPGTAPGRRTRRWWREAPPPSWPRPSPTPSGCSPTTGPPPADVVKTTVFVTDTASSPPSTRPTWPSSGTTARPGRWWRWPALPMGAAVEVEVWAYASTGDPVSWHRRLGQGVQAVWPNR